MATTTMTPANMAIEILRATEDGEKLSPSDLTLVEAAVNGWLSELGEVSFYEIHKRVMGGEYKAPPLFGVEGLSIDHQGYVWWREVHEIEHFTFDGERTRESWIAACEELRRRCLLLESHGKPIDTRSVIWDWPAHRENEIQPVEG